MNDAKNYACEAEQSTPELRVVIARLKNLDDRISHTASDIRNFANRLKGSVDGPLSACYEPAFSGLKTELQQPAMVDMHRTIDSLIDRVSYLQDQFHRISDIA